MLANKATTTKDIILTGWLTGLMIMRSKRSTKMGLNPHNTVPAVAASKFRKQKKTLCMIDS